MIYDKLYTFQKNIVNKFKDKKSFGFFLDMGLGKTPLSLALSEINNCTKVMVITINSKAIEEPNVKGSWGYWNEYNELGLVFNNKKSNEFRNDSRDFLLLNYESLFKRSKTKQKAEIKDNIKNFIKSCKNHKVALIIDESHKIKNIHSLQSIAITKIKKALTLITNNNCYLYLLTGTPFTTGYIDLYAQLKLLGCPMNKTTFEDNFCVKGEIDGLLGWQQPIVGYKNIKTLYNLIHQYAITIKSDDVVDLPDKIFVDHTYDENIDFRLFSNEKFNGNIIYKYLYNKGITDFQNVTKKLNNPLYRDIDYPKSRWLAETTGTFWLRARQLSIGFQGNSEESEWYDKTRLTMLEKFLSENEDNYVLFYNYTPELLEIYEICEKLGYNIDVYCGEIKSLVFYEKFTNLNESKKLTSKKNIILANFASGSTGMNWQEYNKCIIFSMPLYKDYEQGIKRVHRLGQKDTVIYHIFYQNNWLDLGMKKALDEQIDYSEKMFESDLNRIKNLMS